MWTTQGRCPHTHRPNNNRNQLQFDEFENIQPDRKVLSQHGYRGGQQTRYTSFTRILKTIHSYDGFWLHRLLEAHGVRNFVIDPASVQVDRRARRVKTDNIDVGRLLPH